MSNAWSLRALGIRNLSARSGLSSAIRPAVRLIASICSRTAVRAASRLSPPSRAAPCDDIFITACRPNSVTAASTAANAFPPGLDVGKRSPCALPKSRTFTSISYRRVSIVFINDPPWAVWSIRHPREVVMNGVKGSERI